LSVLHILSKLVFVDLLKQEVLGNGTLKQDYICERSLGGVSSSLISGTVNWNKNKCNKSCQRRSTDYCADDTMGTNSPPAEVLTK
jgi:hypothetical protein